MNRLRTLLQQMLSGEKPPPPSASLIGFRLKELGEGSAVFEIDADERHANPMGTLHGGIVVTVGDSAMGTAMATTLGADESYTTLELKSNFLKPIWKARLKASAKVVKRTRSIGLVECDVVDEGGSLVARLSSTCMVLRGDAAQGR